VLTSCAADILRRCLLSRRLLTVCAASTQASQVPAAAGAADYYDRLRGKQVFRSSDGAAVDIPSLIGPGDRAVVAFARSMG
jgi:hypothetical protein